MNNCESKINVSLNFSIESSQIYLADEKTSSPLLDSKMQAIMLNDLKYGENLSYVSYLSYVPGLPTVLKSRAWQWTGDTCRLINSLITIKSKMDQILSSDESLESKAKNLLDISQVLLKMTNSQYGAYLPKQVKENLTWMRQVCDVAKSSLLLKAKLEELSTLDEASLAKTKTELEALLIALDAGYKVIGLVSTQPNLGIKGMINLGYGMTKGAKLGLDTTEYFSQFMPRAASTA